MFFQQVFEPKLAQYAYVIGCQKSGEAVVIDPMRDIDTYHKIAEANNLKIIAAADTHIHADYLSGLREFAEEGIHVYASNEGGPDWLYNWLIGSKYNYTLLKDGDSFSLGNIKFDIVHTPGHTPEHISFLVTDGAGADEPMGILSGDFVFVGDVGRPDLLETAAGQQGVMEGSAKVLYQSLKKFKDMPSWMQVWPGHGAGSACGKALGAVPDSTVGYELKYNASIRASDNETGFVDFILDGQPEPPLYFARMKKENRDGQAVLGGLPKPERVTPEKLSGLLQDGEAVLIDTRTKDEFAAGHLPGSILSTMNKQFNTIAGSYVESDQNIYLLIDENEAEDAVRDLVRVGLDKIEGYITPADLDSYKKSGGKMNTLKQVKFADVTDELKDENNFVLDVRKATEYANGNISGAHNIAHTRLKKHIDEVPADRTVYVHCQMGGRAAVASALLSHHGRDVVLIDDDFGNLLSKELLNA